MNHARRSFDYLTAHECPDWELAATHATLAFAAHAAGDYALHAAHYAQAKQLGEAIAGKEDKAIFYASFNQLTSPVQQ